MADKEIKSSVTDEIVYIEEKNSVTESNLSTKCSVINEVDKNSSDGDEITTVESEKDIKEKYCDANEWLNGSRVLRAEDLRNILKYSSNLSDLSEITIHCENNKNDDNIKCFGEYKERYYNNLKRLNIETFIPYMSDEMIKCLNSLLKNSPKLEHISLGNICYKSGNIKSLLNDVNLSNIITLELHHTFTFDKDGNIYNELKDKICELNKLKSIIIESFLYDDVLNILCLLPNKKNIENMELLGTSINNEKFTDVISEFHNLKKFSFSYSCIKNSIMIDLINKLPIRIETLHFDGVCNEIINDEDEIMSIEIERLIYRNNEHLKRLSLMSNDQYIKSNHIIIKNLNKFSELIEFRYDGNTVAGVDINELCKEIKHLSKLEVISLNVCGIYNKSFEELCNSLCEVPKLKELYISGNKISDINAFLKNIEKYECLEYLNMRGEFVKYEDMIELLDKILKLNNLKILKIDEVKLNEIENEELEKKISEMKEKEKEIEIERVVLTDKKVHTKYNEDYTLAYHFGFRCGYESKNFEKNYNLFDVEDALNGFKDGYKKGDEYRMKEYS